MVLTSLSGNPLYSLYTSLPLFRRLGKNIYQTREDFGDTLQCSGLCQGVMLMSAREERFNVMDIEFAYKG